MEKDLEFLKKFKSKQSDIEAKLEQLESVQHENENLDKAISQAQQRVSLLTGDIQKEEQDNVNFMLKSALKDVEICAAKHLVQETSDEIVVQKSRLLKAKDAINAERTVYSKNLDHFNKEFGYLAGNKLRSRQESVSSEIQSAKEKLNALDIRQDQLVDAFTSKNKLSESVRLLRRDKMSDQQMRNLELNIECQRKEIQKLRQQLSEEKNSKECGPLETVQQQGQKSARQPQKKLRLDSSAGDSAHSDFIPSSKLL